jgi:hypothetical protein
MFSMLPAKEKCLSYVWNHRYQSIQIWFLISRAIILPPRRKSNKRNPHTWPLRRIWLRPLTSPCMPDVFQIRLFTLMRIQIRLSKCCGSGWKQHCMPHTLQMIGPYTANEGPWESNKNVWFRFMYSQKWIFVASLFPKQNYNVLSPSFHIHVSVSDLRIPTIGLPRTDRGNI